MPMLQENGQAEISATPPSLDVEQHQRRRMLIALLLLSVALILVLIKDRQFWFPSNSPSESETAEQNPPGPAAVVPTAAAPAVPQKVTIERTPATLRPKTKRVSAVVPAEAPPNPEPDVSPVVTATNRAVLPPLEVEVVAGDQHQTINPGTNSVHVELQSGSSGLAPSAGTGQENAAASANVAQRVQLSPGAAQILSRPVDPSYPLLAKQMKVQGAVVLQALIDRSGDIQDIQVLSGPAILSAAAREAVRQWRFKPYLQSGRAVETEARITVNFTISTY